MKLALDQAKKNLGNTRDNPSVGCIITKNNQLVSVGHTSASGRPHAEINAINLYRKNLIDSRLYVTLEPCTHFGKTPPCVNLIIKKKFKEVFYSIKDPDPRTFNKSLNILRKKGIGVKEGILKEEVDFFYRSYFKFKKKTLPFVTCKLAISKDFFTINKKRKFITNEYSRGRVHLLRSSHDCIITSSKTINFDDSRLTCRINGLEHCSPARIIFDNKLKIKTTSTIIKEANVHNTIIFYNKNNPKKKKSLKKLKVRLIKIPLDDNLNLDIKMALIHAKKLGFSRIFLECGQKLSTNFLNQNLVDDFKLFISNTNLNNNGDGNLNKFLKTLIKNKKFVKEKVNLLGEKLISYSIK